MTPNFAAASALAQRATSSWIWYTVRASGLLGVALMITLMLSGIGFVTGWTYRFMEPVKAWAVHRALGIALGASILVHMVFILLDNFVKFTIPQVLVPFISTYQPLWVGLGILAAYGTAVIILTSLTIIDTKKKAWKWFHYLSYATFGLVFFHALNSGTEFKYGFIRWAWIAFGVIMLAGILSRLRRAGSLKREA